jgi:hypothetical protein
MTNELKETIKNFLVDFDHTFNEDSFGLADYSLWLDTAINLLEQTIKENN